MKYYYFTAYSTNLVLCVYFLGFPYNGVVDYPNIFLLLYHNLIVFNTDLCCTCTTLSGKRLAVVPWKNSAEGIGTYEEGRGRSLRILSTKMFASS